MTTRSRFARIKAINKGKFFPVILGRCRFFYALCDGVDARLGACRRRTMTVGVEVRCCALLDLLSSLFGCRIDLHLGVCGLKTVSEEAHQVEIFSLQIDSLTFQVLVYYSLLLADNFRASRDLLK